MDHWAPVVRYPPDGVGQFTNEASNFAAATGTFRPAATSTDTSSHGSAADLWLDAYGEITLTALSGTGSKAGIRFRVADSSNFYAVYMTITPTLVIDKVVGGVTTNLLTTAAFAASLVGTLPGTFRAEIQGDTLRGFWRGVFVGSVAGGGAITSPGWASMYVNAVTLVTNVQISRFEAGPLTANASASDIQLASPAGRARRMR